MGIIFEMRLPNVGIITALIIFGLSFFWFGVGYIKGVNKDSDLMAVLSLIFIALGAAAVIVAAFMIPFYGRLDY